MKIGFESQLFLKGNKTGIAWCADNLIKELAATTDWEYELNYFTKGCAEDKISEMQEYEKLGIKLNPCHWFNGTWYKYIWPFIPVPYSAFFGSKSQIIQFFNFVIPPGVKGKKVTIVHDMAHKAYPETVRTKNRMWLNLTLKASCQRADIIITVSEFSKSEIIKYMKIPEEKIVVMLPGVDLTLFHNRYPEESIIRAREKYHIEKKYFLYLGTIEPRKNVRRLIEAYILLSKERGYDMPQLVLAGGRGWLCDDVYQLAKDSKLGDKILFTGYIAEEDSPLLISGAEALCFPSLYEGFGTPPIEAMACGTPVLSSTAASMPEIAGDAAILVNPYSVESIKEGMKCLMEDKHLCRELSEKGLKRAQTFDWKYSADILKKVYIDLMK